MNHVELAYVTKHEFKQSNMVRKHLTHLGIAPEGPGTRLHEARSRLRTSARKQGHLMAEPYELLGEIWNYTFGATDQRVPIPHANWQHTIYHGLPPDLFTFSEDGGDYLAFLGRMSPEKVVDRAIGIAKETGVLLKIAGKIYPEERDYFEGTIAPLLREAGPLVEFVGELGQRERNEFLGKAKALLFPINWPEPFGLVMIEALACGTPVIAWRRGSVPEVLTDGVSGYIAESIPEAVNAVGCLDRPS